MSDPAPHHLSDGQLAAYIDGSLPAPDRAVVDAHMASCHDCRAEFVAAARTVRWAPRQRLWPAVRLGVAAAAAAAAVFLVAVPPNAVSPPEIGEVERLGDRAAALEVVGPGENATVHPDSVLLEWRATDHASYRVTVLDERGTQLWETTTTEPRARIPASAQVPGGSQVYWYVDALRANGTSTSSGLRSFGTAAR